MRYRICAFICVAAIAPSAAAQTLDKTKLRQSIEMPAISTSLGVSFRSSERDGRGNRFDPNVKIAEFQKKMSGAPDDATLYLEQHAVYLECVKDEKKAKEMVIKAEALLRPHMQTTDPKQGHLLTLYGSVLEVLVDNPWGDCEKWARGAVKIAPQDWRTWVYLAHTRNQQIPGILLGDPKVQAKDRRANEVLGALITKRLDKQNVDEAEKVLNESLIYHDKAKELAPNDAKRQEQRYGFRVSEVMLRNGICVYRGLKPTYPLMQLERTLLDELQTAARLQPDHLLWQSQLAHQLIVLGWQSNRDKDGKPAKAFRPARPEDAQTIREALGRIETLATEGRGETSVFCYSMLAAMSSSMQDHAGAEKYARKMLELDPQSQMAGEQLQQALVFQERHADQLQAAQALVKATPSSRNHFLLAKALVLNKRDDLAEAACLAGLKADAADAHCLLGLAALMMRKADDAPSLQTASDLLDKARRECRPEAGLGVFVELDYLSVVHQALSGDAVLARLKLERLHQDYPGVPRYEKALSAISR